MTAPDVAELRKLAEAATPGPWRAALEADQPVCYYRALIGLAACKPDPGYVSVVADSPGESAVELVRENATFIAAANPSAVLALLDHVDELVRDYTEVNAQLGEANEELAKATAWSRDDEPLPEDEAIKAAFPTRSGKHAIYAEAQRMVGAKRSKSALVGLVNWLLVRVDAMTERVDRNVREAGIAWERAAKHGEERDALAEALREILKNDRTITTVTIANTALASLTNRDTKPENGR